MTLKQLLDPLFLRILTDEANNIAVKARQNAGWSSKIPGAISFTSATIAGDGKYAIEIIVDTEKAPMAAAFEYGSGLHRTKGTPGLYPIEAKNASNLVFWWDNQQKWFVGRKLPHGHPGVVARPYLKPAIDKPRIISRIASVFKRGLLDAIKVEFKNGN